MFLRISDYRVQGLYNAFLHLWLLLAYCTTFAAANDHVEKGPQKLLSVGTGRDFDWYSLVPDEKLVYSPCYDGLQCARLSVPLNWNASVENQIQRAAIAIVRLPARVPVTHPQYGGPIVMNPGGPGESGVRQVITGGRYLQQIADAATDPQLFSAAGEQDGKYFDIIGFDPRGVKYTTPHLKCFPDAISQRSWLLSLMDYAVLWDTDSSLNLEWARAKALGQSCAAGEMSIFRYSNTPQVVEDIVAITERHAEWRQAEAERLLKDSTLRFLTTGAEEAIREGSMWRPGFEKLQYWGMSYGSLLGQTFAAMHPQRVGRLVIDGVMSSGDYYNGTWLASLIDSDKVMTKLSEYCYEAGPSKCPLFTGTSGSDVEDWIRSFVFGLKDEPIFVPGKGVGPYGPEVISFGDVILRTINAMTFPQAAAESFFQLIAELAQGNTTAIVAQKQAQQHAVRLSARCREEGPYSDVCISDSYFGLLGTTQSIECIDSAGGPGRTLTKAGFKTYHKKLTKQSIWFSSTWARHQIFCVGFSEELQPAWQFDGPIAGNTSHAILVIGNSHDTVTPLQNAVQATKSFPGAGLIHQNSEGHCSYSNPSVCTAKILRQYFQKGILPPKVTICEPDYRPFIGCVDRTTKETCVKRSEEDEVLWKAQEMLAKVWS